MLPTQEDIYHTLLAAAKAHHEYQDNILGGVRHEQWAGWYAAYVLGRLGEFTTPSQLSHWLDEVNEEKSWFRKAAEQVYEKYSKAAKDSVQRTP